MLGRWPGYFWIYFIGPILGALLASVFYSLLGYLNWKECNQGQDWNDVEKLQSEKRSDDQSRFHLEPTQRPICSPHDMSGSGQSKNGPVVLVVEQTDVHGVIRDVKA